MKTINALKRHRKQRHAILRELTREDEIGQWWGKRRAEGDAEVTTCPVCGAAVTGDIDVVEAHVDACLAHLRLQEVHDGGHRSQRANNLEVDVDVDINDAGAPENVMNGVNFTGMFFVLVLMIDIFSKSLRHRV